VDAETLPEFKRLLDLERSGWDSLCDGTGGEFYGKLMTADGLMVLANGQVMTREAVVDALSDAPPWNSYRLDDARMVELGPNSAALVYVGTGRRDADDSPFVGAMTSVYVHDGHTWKLAVYQQTPMPGH
jgi:hypothetical protein